MKHNVSNFKDLKIAVLFSATLALFGVITNNSPLSDIEIVLLFPAWFLGFSFLIISWYLNSIITNLFLFRYKKWNQLHKIFIVFLLNSLMLFFFILLGIYISDTIHYTRDFNIIYMAFRGSVSIAIIYLVQYTLNLNSRNQAFLLQNQMLKTENIRAQFEILKQQISPHFLFNSLASLRSMIRSSNIHAENFVIKLSDIYRLILANKEKDTITIKEELEFIESYSFLLFSRYENMLCIEIEIPQNFLEYKIPTFTLQLLVENCVKHNIVSKKRPLRIKIFDSGLDSISVENNLQYKLNREEKSGIGLENLSKRYELLGISNGVQVFSNESVYRVKVKLFDK